MLSILSHCKLRDVFTDFVFNLWQIFCVEKKNQLDATELFISLIICSTFFGDFYAHHQELETICVLLLPTVCDALVAGCWRSGAGQPAMRSVWGMLLDYDSSRASNCVWSKNRSNEAAWERFGVLRHRKEISSNGRSYFLSFITPQVQISVVVYLDWSCL